MTRKRKMTVDDLFKECPAYYNYARASVGGNRGWAYYLERPLTEREKQTLSDKYTNVTFLVSVAQYAPEQKTQVMHLADKAIYKERGNNA